MYSPTKHLGLGGCLHIPHLLFCRSVVLSLEILFMVVSILDLRELYCIG